MTHESYRLVSGFTIALALCAALTPAPCRAQVRVLDDGPIHEAFVPPVMGVAPLEAIATPPPPPIVEKPPAKCDPEAIWIKGYFDYNEQTDDFDWVGGCWRKPPRGMVWVDGFWQEFPEGWVWIRGFWSPKPAAELAYIDDAPPDPLDEDPPVSPGANYFWLAGYYEWKPSGYAPYSGRWIEMDPDWVLVPATYVWRPEGYAFVPAHWDWPIEKRGCTYQTIYIEPAARVNYVYEPTVIVEPAVVVGWCYYSYPNYVYFLHHHYHHHHAFWVETYDVPTWWGWHGWWAHSWHDHWGLWWWYGHPGYPAPGFMTASYAAMIHPPHEKTVYKFKTVVKAPKIVTAKGVVTPKESRELAKKGKGKDFDDKKGKSLPLVAASPKSKDKDGKDDKDDKKDFKKDNDKLASNSLRPTGTKSAKDFEDDDPKNHPPKPKGAKSATGGPSPAGAGKGAPAITKFGDTKGKDDDKDKSKGKTSGPPITGKGKTPEPDIKVKGKDDDKEKMKGKSGGPPITTKGPPAAGDPKPKGTDKPKGKDKDDDRPKGPANLPPSGDKSKDKPKDLSPKKSSGTLPPSPPTGDLRPKDKDKPPRFEDKPPGGRAGDGKPSGGRSDGKPPGLPAGDAKGKDKDKDKDPRKKKDRD